MCGREEGRGEGETDQSDSGLEEGVPGKTPKTGPKAQCGVPKGAHRLMF